MSTHDKLPLEAIPRTVLTTGPFPGVPERRTLVIDAATTFYLHREGEGVLMGMVQLPLPQVLSRGPERETTRQTHAPMRPG